MPNFSFKLDKHPKDITLSRDGYTVQKNRVNGYLSTYSSTPLNLQHGILYIPFKSKCLNQKGLYVGIADPKGLDLEGNVFHHDTDTYGFSINLGSQNLSEEMKCFSNTKWSGGKCSQYGH